MDSGASNSASVMAGEMQMAAEWTSRHFAGKEPAFSFTFGGRPSAELLPTWKRDETTLGLDEKRTQWVTTYTDTVTGLLVRCEGIAYSDFPMVEWTVYFKNTGTDPTPILEGIRAVDWLVENGSRAVTLHYHVGSPTAPEDYRPLVEALPPGSLKQVATSGGRPSNAHLPYFNLEWSGGGVIVAIGWPGQWDAQFFAGPDGQTRISAGQELTHFTLYPGEKVRSPLVAIEFYQGDWIRGQNLWRRWMVAHNLPRPGGAIPQPLVAASNWAYCAPYGLSNAQAMKVFIDYYEAREIPINLCWIDAGWYECDSSIPLAGYSLWSHTGTWTADPRRYPNGVREVFDHAHRKGLKTILWFEPERVMEGTWLALHHPEWLLAAPANPGDQVYSEKERLLDLGSLEAWQWLVEHVDGLLTQEAVDIYREDLNMDPLSFWRANDAPDRQGITEIRHVTGHLGYWDELRRRRPQMLLDTCASGGKRNDLESLRRAVPLWRTDFTRDTSADQCIMYGISFWIPYSGSGVNRIDPYLIRSRMGSSLSFDLDPRRDDLDVDLWRRLVQQLKQVAPYYLCDYYPLTPYSLEPDVWMAWQFDCPQAGQGMVQAFRREKSPRKTACYRLRGLEAEATYELIELDSQAVQHLSGRTLMEEGLRVEVNTRPAAVIFRYERL